MKARRRRGDVEACVLAGGVRVEHANASAKTIAGISRRRVAGAGAAAGSGGARRVRSHARDADGAASRSVPLRAAACDSRAESMRAGAMFMSPITSTRSPSAYSAAHRRSSASRKAALNSARRSAFSSSSPVMAGT